MNHCRSLYHTHLIILFFFLYGCANQIAPTGGPKDETAPKLVSSVPENNTLNYNQSFIQLTFDEPIQIVGLKNELIITPTYTGEYTSKSRKYEVEVNFEEPFADSTTYVLNFRNAIKDVTESNPAEDLVIAFSTWSFLDSLSITGTVKELLTDTPVLDYTVGIYSSNDTLDAFNGIPLYFTKTDSSGTYSLNNLKSDEYFIYAFNDRNDNLTIQSKSEKYGFLSDPIPLDSSVYNVDIGVINLDLTDLAIQSARQNGQYYELKTSKYVTDYDLKTPNSDSTLYSKILDDHKTIVLYNTFQIADSLELYVTLQDSLYNTITDTVYVKYSETRRQKDEFTSILRKAQIHKDNRNFAAQLEFSKPVVSIGFDSLYIAWDSLRKSYFDSSMINYERNRRFINIQTQISQSNFDSLVAKNEQPILFLKESAIISIEKDTITAQKKEIQLIESKDLGVIKGSISLDSVSYFIQLLDEKNQILRTEYNLNEYTFEDVPPGNYRIRLLIDENNDGIWHPGNFLKSQQPEPVFYFTYPEGTQLLTLRANWELIDIDVDSLEKPVDNVETTSDEL